VNSPAQGRHAARPASVASAASASKRTRGHVHHALTGTGRAASGPREAMTACRAGDVLVVTKLDRLARCLPDARDILAEHADCHVASVAVAPATIGTTRSAGCCPPGRRSVTEFESG